MGDMSGLPHRSECHAAGTEKAGGREQAAPRCRRDSRRNRRRRAGVCLRAGAPDAPPAGHPEAATGRTAWLHFNINDARARRWIQERAAVPAPATEVLLGPDMRIQSEVLPDGFIAVLGDLAHDFHDEAMLHTIRVYVDRQRMITARRHPLRSSDLLRRELQAPDAVASLQPIQLFERLVDCLGRTFSQAVTALARPGGRRRGRHPRRPVPAPGQGAGPDAPLAGPAAPPPDRQPGGAGHRCPHACRRPSPPRRSRTCGKRSNRWTASPRTWSWCRNAPGCCRKRSPAC